MTLQDHQRWVQEKKAVYNEDVSSRPPPRAAAAAIEGEESRTVHEPSPSLDGGRQGAAV